MRRDSRAGASSGRPIDTAEAIHVPTTDDGNRVESVRRCWQHRRVTDQLSRARGDLARGRAWKARDRLHGLLRDRQDVEVLDLLATVHQAMSDLPAAGALWFVTGRDDPTARAAVAAWHERHGNAEARWRSIPASIRRGQVTGNLRTLEAEVREGPRTRGDASSSSERTGSRWQPLVVGGGALLFALWLVAMICIGVITTLGWIWD
ncbi:DUF6584 family protein [Terrabacter sp. NPDC000476]|uniref:DUF6584 family protein n=1 Tax=Terrabacter sp. NPDC000476 TaxID=3154258 RepID=UPI0033279886